MDPDKRRMMEEAPFIPISIRLDDLHSTVSRVLKFIHSPYSDDIKNDSDQNLLDDITNISGGITNSLYLAESKKYRFVIRVFGKGTSDFLDREKENEIFAKLSEDGVGPKLHAKFLNGRVEEFINGRTLTVVEMKDPLKAASIARAVVMFHKVAASIRISPQPCGWEKIALFLHLGTSSKDDSHSVYQTFVEEFDWYRQYMERYLQSLTLRGNREEEGHHGISHDDMRALGALFGSLLVLSHNDLLSGNMMVLRGDVGAAAGVSAVPVPQDTITLIDYEYAGLNYRAWDLANFFCEASGFDFVVQDQLPPESYRKHFLMCYVREFFSHSAVLSSSCLNGDKTFTGKTVDAAALQVVCESIRDEMISLPALEAFIDGLHDIVLRFTLASDIFWGTWAIVQSERSDIDFDYDKYAKLRLDSYFFHKGAFTGNFV